MVKTYRDLIQYSTFEDRLQYLYCSTDVGIETFGNARWLNQEFYNSPEWKNVRNYVIVRDNGCDIAMPGYEIHSKIVIHHINPITVDDFENDAASDKLFDPNNLVCVSFDTHNCIHSGKSMHNIVPNKRIKNDTKLW